MSQVNYKDKYLQLKQRFMESVDVAFRLGFEQGTQAAQMQQMQEQQQQIADQQAQQAQMAANGGQPGQPGQDDGMGGDPSQGNPTQGGAPGAQIQDDSRGVGQQTGAAGGMGGSELDQHIGELEGLMAKSEYGSQDWEVLHKQISICKSAKLQADMKKNEILIKSIGTNLRKPLKLNPRANHNMAHPAKAALSLQQQIVGGIMDTWEKEEKGLPTEISKILATEGLTKKE